MALTAHLNEQRGDALRMMYCEHTDQARHHDAMRERSTALIVEDFAAKVQWTLGGLI
jgi:hypothetical protein